MEVFTANDEPGEAGRTDFDTFQVWPHLTVKVLTQGDKNCTPLTLARKRCFATFAGVGGGGWCDPPWRFPTKRRRASRKRPADCARRVLAIGGIIFGTMSIFDQVMAGQSSNFRKFRDFF